MSDTYKFWPLDAPKRHACEVSCRYAALGLKNHADAAELWVWLQRRPSANVVRKAKESQLHGQAPHSPRPGAQPAHLESRDSKSNVGRSFGVLPAFNLVSSPNVERKTRSLTVNEVESSRERTPEYCTTSNSGRCCGGVCARKQRSEGGHYWPFWWDSLLDCFFFFFFLLLPQN